MAEALERRDHPGSMLDVSIFSLLRLNEGASSDLVKSLLQAADDAERRAESTDRSQQRAQRPTPNGSALLPQNSDGSQQVNHDMRRERLGQMQRFRDALADLPRSPRRLAPANPLLDAISQQLTHPLDHPPSDQVERSSGVELAAPGITTGSGAAGGSSSGGAKLPVASPSDSVGATMQPHSSAASNSAGGGGSSADATGASTQSPAGPTGADAGGDLSAADPPAGSGGDSTADPPSDSLPTPDAGPTSDTPSQVGASAIFAAAGIGADLPNISVATTSLARGEGRYVVAGTIGTGLQGEANRDLTADLFVRRDGGIRFLGEAKLSGSPSQLAFRISEQGRLYPGDEVVVHQHLNDGLLGLVSEIYVVQQRSDIDGDGVEDRVEGMARLGDGNADGVYDAEQQEVASLLDVHASGVATLNARGKSLQKVQSVHPRFEQNANRLPLGLYEFEVHNVRRGGIQAIDVHLPADQAYDGWFKEDPATGRLRDFFFDGTTGAVPTDFGFTLYLQDGGRGDDDGIANGIIIDPSGPGIAGSITLGEAGTYDHWTDRQHGGTTQPGSVDYADGVYAVEGDSLLVAVEQTITVPEDPSWLSFGFEAFFDDLPSGRINDAFEVALLDQDGFSVIPTHQRSRDSFFNIAERSATTLIDGELRYDPAVSLPDAIDNREFVAYFPDPQRSTADVTAGFVDVDISDLMPGQVLNIVLRLVNNDGDHGSWFRLVQDLPIPAAINDSFTLDQGTILNASHPGYVTLTANDRDGDDALLRPLSVIAESVTTPAGGSVAVDSDGNFTYTPDPAFTGTDTFSYKINNGVFDSPTAATVTVEVIPVNRPPNAVDDDFGIIDEDASVTVDVLANDTDPDTGDSVAVSHINGSAVAIGDSVSVANATVTLTATEQLSIVPDADYHGPISFSYAITDGEYADAATVSGTVQSINDPPVQITPIPPQSGVDLAQATPLKLRDYFHDVDAGTPLTIAATGYPAGLAFDPVSGFIQGAYAADASADSVYTVTVRATDEAGQFVESAEPRAGGCR